MEGREEGIRASVVGRWTAGVLLTVAFGVAGDVYASSLPLTVLTMAVPGTFGPSANDTAFARSVERLSKGTLLITFKTPTQLTADGELVLIREVEQGAVQMGSIPTGAWDAVGLQSFAALQAPFLITNYALVRKVLEGPLGRGMLAGTRAAGIRTLGLAVEDLHVPLGARRPFVGLTDFRGTTLRVPSNSALTTAILDALGAKAVSIPSGHDEFVALKSGTIDGAVTALGPVLLNGYYGAAKYLTTNLVFFPLVRSVGINEQAFEALSAAQRSILTKAAAEMTRGSFVGRRAHDQQLLRILCADGLKVATSTRAQLATLRRAQQPVYTYLETNRATAARIAKIQTMQKETKPTRPLATPKGCAA
jgi:C4-dicarboxylate-binding protein DctP